MSRWNVILFITLIAFFLGISFWQLDRFPTIHLDETIILEPGYNLFRTGHFNAPMYTGLQGREVIYLEVMPVMSLLQGAMSRLIGIGAWQMRVIPVLSGAIILGLTFRIGGELSKQGLHNSRVSIHSTSELHSKNVVLAAILSGFWLLFWKWTPGHEPFLESGIALVDVGRIARYDILVPVFGLGAYLAWLKERWFLSGVLVGLAGLSNVYGFFWLAALLALTAGDQVFFGRGDALRQAGKILAGTFLAVLPWVVVILLNWPTFTAQFAQHGHRFQLFSPAFYWANLTHEVSRYHLGFGEIASFARLGFWLAVVGIPVCLIGLAWRVIREKDRMAFYLLVPVMLLPFLLAVLIGEKKFYYLLMVIPLFAILLGWGFAVWLGANRRWQWAAWLILICIGIEGLVSIGSMQKRGFDITPTEFFSELQQNLPSEGIVLGPQPYWLAFPEGNYRSIHLPLLLANPYQKNPLSLTTALEHISPAYILVHPDWQSWLATGWGPNGEETAAEFWAYMEVNQAALIYSAVDYEGKEVQIYELALITEARKK